MTEYQAVIDRCGAQPSNCSCEKCQNMCKRSPCLGTPSDILRLINNGYTGELQPTIWAAGLAFGYPAIPLVIFSHLPDKSCILFSGGRCPLHDRDLKPLEGRLASCAKANKTPIIGFTVARTWADPANEKTIALIFKALTAYDNTMKKLKDPFKHFRTVQTPDGYTATIHCEETPHRIATHRYRIVITDASGKQLCPKIFQFKEADAIRTAEQWRPKQSPLNFR